MKTTAKPKKNRSKTSLAARLGVSRSTLYSWRDQGAPVEKGEAAVLEWALAETKRDVGSDDMKKAKLAVLTQTARRLKTANDTRSGTLVDLATVRGQTAEAMGVLFRGLDVFVQEMPEAELKVAALKQNVRVAFAEIAGDKLAMEAALKEGAKVMARMVSKAVTARTFAEKTEHEYQTFRRWLAETQNIRGERRAEWLRLRSAAGLPVPDANGSEVQEFGVKRA